jgi:hypothetical protein
VAVPESVVRVTDTERRLGSTFAFRPGGAE